jgi:hypothetical protein
VPGRWRVTVGVETQAHLRRSMDGPVECPGFA